MDINDGCHGLATSLLGAVGERRIPEGVTNRGQAMARVFVLSIVGGACSTTDASGLLCIDQAMNGSDVCSYE